SVKGPAVQENMDRPPADEPGQVPDSTEGGDQDSSTDESIDGSLAQAMQYLSRTSAGQDQTPEADAELSQQEVSPPAQRLVVAKKEKSSAPAPAPAKELKPTDDAPKKPAKPADEPKPADREVVKAPDEAPKLSVSEKRLGICIA